MTENFLHLLMGKDLRSLARNKEVIKAITTQESFDELFVLIFHHERKVRMRAIDAVEKITRKAPQYLKHHKDQLFSVLHNELHIEMKWHVAQLLSRVTLNENQLHDVSAMMLHWALNPNESKIVRVNALQALHDLSTLHPQLRTNYLNTLHQMEHVPIPSIQARIKKLLKKKF